MSQCTFFTSKLLKQWSVWNKELLYVGGFLARAAYELEMQDIRVLWDASVASNPGEPLNSELRKGLYDKARHNLQFFTFRESTPSAVVSSEMRSVFFSCVTQEQPFSIISSTGIRSALDVRMPDPAFSAFLKKLPIFPEALLKSSKLIVAALQERGMLRDITFEDVLKELRERSLPEEEMAACLQWWINTSQQNPAEAGDIRQKFLDAARLIVGPSNNGDERIIPSKRIQTFLSPRNVVIPTDGPLPSHLLPISVSHRISSDQLQRYLRWRELTVVEWIQHIANPVVYQSSGFNIVESPVWAERVLQVLGRSWSTLSQTIKTSIVGLLNRLTCIPTSFGMKMPSKVYFPSAGFFQDLPIVKFPSGAQIKGGLQEVLADLGVRRYIDLEVIYNL